MIISKILETVKQFFQNKSDTHTESYIPLVYDANTCKYVYFDNRTGLIEYFDNLLDYANWRDEREERRERKRELSKLSAFSSSHSHSFFDDDDYF